MNDELNRAAHRASHGRTRKAYIWQTPRVANIQSGATRTSIGTYPDATDGIVLADAVADGFNTSFLIPSDWQPLTPIFTTQYFSMSNATGGNVVLRSNYLEMTGSEAGGDAGTQVDVTITPVSTADIQTTRRQLMIPTETLNMVRLNLGRVGGDAADTYAADFRFVGLAIEYTTRRNVI